MIGYEPAYLTEHNPPPPAPRTVPKEKPEYFGVIQVKGPQNVVFSIFT